MREQQLVCRQCGREFGGQEVAGRLKQEGADEVHFVCPACGADNRVDVTTSSGLGRQPRVTALDAEGGPSS